MFPKIAIVGAGITGVLTALACARKGAEVDLYDMNDIPNKQSNSWASARLYRVVHDGAPCLEELAARSELFWKNMMLQSGGKLIRPVTIIRINNEPDLLLLKHAYDRRQRDNCIAEVESSRLGYLFKLKDSSHKVLTGRDGFLLNADQIYQQLIDEISTCNNITLISNSRFFMESGRFMSENSAILNKYLKVVFCTSAPVISKSRSAKKKYQYHIDVTFEEGNYFWDAILDMGDENKTWCVPSMDGKTLKLSASKFSFDEYPNEKTKNNCREYLHAMLKIPHTVSRENISSYYEIAESINKKPWQIDRKSGCVLMQACNAQHFKTAPATAEDISNYVFQ